jgi:hypothetical protein
MEIFMPLLIATTIMKMLTNFEKSADITCTTLFQRTIWHPIDNNYHTSPGRAILARHDYQIAKLKAEVRAYAFSVEPFERGNTHIMERTEMLSDRTTAERPNEQSCFTVLSQTERTKHRLKG